MNCNFEYRQIVDFLRNLANELEQDKINQVKKTAINELYVICQLQDLEQDQSNHSLSENTEFSNDDLLKFIMLGWYIYCCILRENKHKKLSQLG